MALKDDYACCRKMAKTHYENFPVISFLFSRDIGNAVAAIYAFARMADDIADESNDPANIRKAKLNLFAEKIKAIETAGVAIDNIDSPEARNQAMALFQDDPYFLALFDTIVRHQLNPQYFLDLLSAFSFDTTLNTIKDETELFWYCQRSANPIGRLLLSLFKVKEAQALAASDALCTCLQLVNFMQDWHEDLTKRYRIYFPMNELLLANISVQELIDVNPPEKIQHFLQQAMRRPQALLQKSNELLPFLPLRYRLHIFLVILGARGIIHALNERKAPNKRPTLSLSILASSFFRAA